MVPMSESNAASKLQAVNQPTCRGLVERKVVASQWIALRVALPVDQKSGCIDVTADDPK